MSVNSLTNPPKKTKNKQTKKTKNLYWVPFLAKKRHPNALKGTWPKVPLCEVYSFLTAGERGKMTVMIFRGGLGRLEEQTSRWPSADRPSPVGPPCLCSADSLPLSHQGRP